MATRPARTGDLAALEALRAAARRELEGRRGGAHLGPHLLGADGLAAALAGEDPSRCLIVGLLGESRVGVASAAMVTTAPGGERLARLDLLYVDPPARRQGVGAALLGDVLAWAADLGCDGMDAPALPGDRALKSLYEANGLRARLLVLHRRLSVDEDVADDRR